MKRRLVVILGILVLVGVLVVAMDAGRRELSEDDRWRLCAAVQEMRREYGHVREMIFIPRFWPEGQIVLSTRNAEDARFVEQVVPRYYRGWPVVVQCRDDFTRLHAAALEMLKEYGHVRKITFFTRLWPEGQIRLSTTTPEDARYVEQLVPRYYKGWPVVVKYQGDDFWRLIAAVAEMQKEYGHVPKIRFIMHLWPEGKIMVSTESPEDAKYVELNVVPACYKGWRVVVTVGRFEVG